MSKSVFIRNKVYKPMMYQWAEDLRQQSEQMHWITDEVDFNQDLVDFRTKLTEDERDFVKNIMSIFTQSDEEVGNYYVEYLLPRVKNNEVRGMLSSFNCREWEHQRGYAQLNESLGLPDKYYTEFMEHQETLDKYEFYINNEVLTNYGAGLELPLTIAKQVLTEGISLFGAFIMLKNFERHGLLMATCKINEWSLKDETLHIEGNSKLFNEVCNELYGKERPIILRDLIYDMAETAVKLEHRFIDFAFNKHEIRTLKAQETKDYILYIANRRLNQLGYDELFDIDKNPLPWFEELANGSSLQNFFEGRSADYDVAGLVGEYKYDS